MARSRFASVRYQARSQMVTAAAQAQPGPQQGRARRTPGRRSMTGFRVYTEVHDPVGPLDQV